MEINLSLNRLVACAAQVAVAAMVATFVVSASLVVAQSPSDEIKNVSEARPMNNERLGQLLKQHFPKVPFSQKAANVWIIKPDGDPDSDAETKPAQQAEAKPEAEKNDQAPKQEEAAAVADIDGMLLVMTDETANRMRIMMPIQSFDPSRPQDFKTALIALQANYDRALDARYAVSDGILWSAYLHPLRSLTEEDLASALDQVRTLRKTTGTTYNSGALQFAPVTEEAPAEEKNSVEKPGDPTV